MLTHTRVHTLYQLSGFLRKKSREQFGNIYTGKGRAHEGKTFLKKYFEQAYLSCQKKKKKEKKPAKKLFQNTWIVLPLFPPPNCFHQAVNKIPESLGNSLSPWTGERAGAEEYGGERGASQKRLHLTISTAANQIFDFAHLFPFENTCTCNKGLIQTYEGLVRTLWAKC